MSTLVYKIRVTRMATNNRISPATRNRGRSRRAVNVLDGSKKTPVRVSGVDIPGSPDAGALGGAIVSLILILLWTVDG